MANAGSLKTRQKRMIGVSVMFLLPTFFLLGVFMFRSIGDSFHLSLTDWDGVKPVMNYIGLSNWADLLATRKFWFALGNNLKIMALSITVQLPAAMALAFLVGQDKLVKGMMAGAVKG